MAVDGKARGQQSEIDRKKVGRLGGPAESAVQAPSLAAHHLPLLPSYYLHLDWDVQAVSIELKP